MENKILNYIKKSFVELSPVLREEDVKKLEKDKAGYVLFLNSDEISYKQMDFLSFVFRTDEIIFESLPKVQGFACFASIKAKVTIGSNLSLEEVLEEIGG